MIPNATSKDFFTNKTTFDLVAFWIGGGATAKQFHPAPAGLTNAIGSMNGQTDLHLKPNRENDTTLQIQECLYMLTLCRKSV
jgi:hypothetical protein